jgi:hypothetical protein
MGEAIDARSSRWQKRPNVAKEDPVHQLEILADLAGKPNNDLLDAVLAASAIPSSVREAAQDWSSGAAFSDLARDA